MRKIGARMLKADVLAVCREAFKDDPDCFRGDAIAKREYFNNYTDALCKDGFISRHQYETWTNPF